MAEHSGEHAIGDAREALNAADEAQREVELAIAMVERLEDAE